MAGIVAAVLSCASQPAAAAEDTNLPIPRFVTLRSEEANARTGPGTQYPIEWRFMRRGMPVEITAQFSQWRKIRDWQGAEGWVHQSLVSGRRAIVVTGIPRILRRRAADDASPVAQVEAGVIGRLMECDPGWCRMEVQGYRGWLKRTEFWGVYPGEKVE
ncbi:SH3 domain-containing protein [Allostella humosa]|uniref:SH3 domain-containing protein n=1 Tax=Stella humosa TaxID=94 RepID=UPI001FE589D3|nr:SH3 domain-containing protein [Stella humosa]